MPRAVKDPTYTPLPLRCAAPPDNRCKTTYRISREKLECAGENYCQTMLCHRQMKSRRKNLGAIVSTGVCGALVFVGIVRLISYSRGATGDFIRSSALGVLGYNPDSFINVQFFKILAIFLVYGSLKKSLIRPMKPQLYLSLILE